jgi:hypothetical protein
MFSCLETLALLAVSFENAAKELAYTLMLSRPLCLMLGHYLENLTIAAVTSDQIVSMSSLEVACGVSDNPRFIIGTLSTFLAVIKDLGGRFVALLRPVEA